MILKSGTPDAGGFLSVRVPAEAAEEVQGDPIQASTLFKEATCMSTVPTNINNYLRQFAHQLEERILQQFPPLHQPGEPFPAELARLRRTPYHAQSLAIAGISKRWEVENSAGAIAECGTGKTLISLGAMFVNSEGRPFTALVMAPPQLTIKWCRETLLTLPRVRVFLIDGVRNGVGSNGHTGVNEVRLRNGRIVREGLQTTLSDLRLRKQFKSARARWQSLCDCPAVFVLSREVAKLSYFWRHAYGVPRSGPFNGSIVNPDMDLPAWEHDLRCDLTLIEGLYGEMQKIAPSDDAKLQHLKTQILSKLASPINPGNRKILIFTAFADTANYLYENLAATLLAHQRLHTGRVTGTDTPKSTLGRGYDFQPLLTLFSPLSKEKAAIMPEEPGEIDVLIGTDCISEGQNLQDCDYLINYDIHWNPVRIIQRFGRIDRIGSRNTCIQLVNYWPDITLDEYINLKERVENRMVIADVTATGDDNVLNSKANDLSYRKEQLRRLQEEVIEMEDLKTGVSITDLGLNDFRMDLLNYLKINADLAGVPSGMHAVVPADPERGLPPGVIFTLRNRNQSVNIDQQNRLHPYYLIYIASGGPPRVIVNHTEVKRVLDLVRSACKGRGDPIPEAYRPFNLATQDGREMQPYSELLAQAIRSMVDLKEEKDIDSLFTGPKTSALVSPIAGLDDFELIAFLVVQAVA
jgi:SNF2 family DNA or RNA helicase